MGLLIAATVGVIVFLVVEGRRAMASTSPQSPVTGAAGAPAGTAETVTGNFIWGPGSSLPSGASGSPSIGDVIDALDGFDETNPGATIPAVLGPVRPYGS